MKSTLAMLAVAATFGLSALDASATDITVVNQGGADFHPYYRTNNCWNPTFNVVPDANGWVFFGGISAHSQFTWPGFEQLLDPACKHVKLEFTYTLDANPPVRNPKRDVRQVMDFGKLGATEVITVVDHPIIQRPDDEDGDD